MPPTGSLVGEGLIMGERKSNRGPTTDRPDSSGYSSREKRWRSGRGHETLAIPQFGEREAWSLGEGWLSGQSERCQNDPMREDLEEYAGCKPTAESVLPNNIIVTSCFDRSDNLDCKNTQSELELLFTRSGCC